jgi:hypothetical protein
VYFLFNTKGNQFPVRVINELFNAGIKSLRATLPAEIFSEDFNFIGFTEQRRYKSFTVATRAAENF